LVRVLQIAFTALARIVSQSSRLFILRSEFDQSWPRSFLPESQIGQGTLGVLSWGTWAHVKPNCWPFHGLRRYDLIGLMADAPYVDFGICAMCGFVR
jgi:hypothetical protein